MRRQGTTPLNESRLAAHNPFLERLPPYAEGGQFHQQIAEAIRGFDPAGARQGMVAHLRQSSTDLRAVM